MKINERISLESARFILDTHISPITHTESLPIDAATGRVLAQNITAAYSTPPFDRAVMDGYALIAADTEGVTVKSPHTLTVIETVFAGSIPTKKVSAGQCTQIATGARIPAGANAVVMLEDIKRQGNVISVFKPISADSNIAREGEDIKQGTLILAKGTFLDPGRVGVLASQGLSRVKVYGRPKVAVMPTGEEVVPVGSKLRAGQLYDINSHTLAAVIQASGGQPLILPVSSDDRHTLKRNLEKALKADMVVTSGGSSVGERDLLFETLSEQGEILFHGIKIRPGKPVTFALVQGKPIIGMPGYPASCLVNAYMLLIPAVRKLAHLPPQKTVAVQARLEEGVRGMADTTQFLPVLVEGQSARSVFKGSGAITSIAHASGYVVIPAGDAGPAAGTEVTVNLF